MSYDDVAVERALAGDRSVRLLEDEQTEILRRLITGTLPPGVLTKDVQRLLRLNGTQFMEAVQRQRDRISA